MFHDYLIFQCFNVFCQLKIYYVTVCRTTMKEVDVEILKIHPDKVINVGSHRMDAQGNTIYKQVEKKY